SLQMAWVQSAAQPSHLTGRGPITAIPIAAGSEDREINFPDLPRHALVAKNVGKPLLAAASQPAAKLHVGGDPPKRCGQTVDVPRRDEQPSPLVEDHFPSPIDVVADR